MNLYLSDSIFHIHWDKSGVFLRSQVTSECLLSKYMFLYFHLSLQEKVCGKRKTIQADERQGFLIPMKLLESTQVLKSALWGVLFNMHVTVDKVSAGRNHILTADI